MRDCHPSEEGRRSAMNFLTNGGKEERRAQGGRGGWRRDGSGAKRDEVS